MLKLFTHFLATITSVLGISPVKAAGQPLQAQALIVKPGDLIARKEGVRWNAIKILAVDPWPDGSAAAHCLNYEAAANKPTMDSIKKVAVRIWHAPIDAGSFAKNWELIGNQALVKDEFFGFIEYLKLTDFPRYINFTGQDAKEIVRKANEHYSKAYAFGEQAKRDEAISEYSEAIELFPLFYEAIDNRGITYMELGKLQEALQDFDASLRVNPSGFSAFFSRGQCLMKLDQLNAAEAAFREGQTRFPEKLALFTKFIEQVRTLQKDS